MVENSPLDASTWIRRIGLDFKDSIAPPMVFLVSSIPLNKDG